MRMIGTIPHAEHAERFSDYLVTQGIENMVEESSTGGGWTVWVEHDDHLERGRSELAAFQKNPGDAKYDKLAARAPTIRKEQARQQERRRRHFVDVRTSWSQPQQWAAPVTLSLIALSIVVSVATGSIGFGPKREALLDKLMFTSRDEQAFAQWQIEHAAEIEGS